MVTIDPNFKYILTANSCPLCIAVVEDGTPLGLAYYLDRIDDRVRYQLGNRTFVLKIPKQIN